MSNKVKRQIALIREQIYDYYQQQWQWEIIGESEIYGVTEKSIKIKMHWWKKPCWYSRDDWRRRYELITTGDDDE